MKKLSALFLVFFVFALFTAHNSFAQSKSFTNENVDISFGDEKVSFTLTAGVETIKTSASGNYKRIITFQLDPEDPFLNLSMPYAIVRISLNADIDGEKISIKDKRVVVTPSGFVKIVHHYNGKK